MHNPWSFGTVMLARERHPLNHVKNVVFNRIVWSLGRLTFLGLKLIAFVEARMLDQ